MLHVFEFKKLLRKPKPFWYSARIKLIQCENWSAPSSSSIIYAALATGRELEEKKLVGPVLRPPIKCLGRFVIDSRFQLPDRLSLLLVLGFFYQTRLNLLLKSNYFPTCIESSKLNEWCYKFVEVKADTSKISKIKKTKKCRYFFFGYFFFLHNGWGRSFCVWTAGY